MNPWWFLNGSSPAMASAVGGAPGQLPSLPPQSSEAIARLAGLHTQAVQSHAQLWNAMLQRDGKSEARSNGEEPGDRRFAAEEWGADPFHDYVRRSYLINAGFAMGMVDAVDLDGESRGRLRFAMRQMVDSLSPANFAVTNPEVLRVAQETQGESIAQGIRNLMADLQKGRISTSDESRFEVGRNLAVTPGAVIFENELMQLIQYAPVTVSVYRRPLVIVPPCINKFYILDLQAHNSFVRHAVAQGHTVFMISWKNVLEDQQHLRWDDYLSSGVLSALDTARRITGADSVNALGFCVGGTMLSAALGVLKARGESWVESLTLLASLLDFSETGDIGLMVDESSIAMREAQIGGEEGGILPGRDLAQVFSALRANDLIWSYVVNNYLKGLQPDAFDILYWNADSTNLPGRMYCWYVRNMYLHNSLRVPGKLEMLGEKVSLAALTMPAYVLATREDHIVPWATAYQSVHILGGESRFVLGASGHVAGVINPAEANRRSYWSNPALPQDPQQWLLDATEMPGSWWRDWADWLAPHGGDKIKARKRLGGAGFKKIEAAPGRYVARRVT